MSQTKSQSTDQPTIVYGSGRKPDAAIPRPGIDLRKGHVAIVVTDAVLAVVTSILGI